MDLIERAVGVGVERAVGIGNDIALRFGEIRGVPSVQPRNVAALAEHLKGFGPNERIVTIGQGLSSAILNPHIIIDDDSRRQIRAHTSAGGVLLLVGNHVNNFDPLTYSAVVEAEPAFSDVRKDIIIPAKPIIFRIPGVRSLAEGMGAFPTIRKKDVTEENGTITKENQEFQAASGKLTVETVVGHLRSRGSAFILGEGARNKKSPLIVQGFEKGAAFMYEQAVKAGVKVKIVTAGVYYDGSARRATVAVNGLFEFDPEQRFSGPRSRYLQQATQLCVNRAFEAATSRR